MKTRMRIRAKRLGVSKRLYKQTTRPINRHPKAEQVQILARLTSNLKAMVAIRRRLPQHLQNMGAADIEREYKCSWVTPDNNNKEN